MTQTGLGDQKYFLRYQTHFASLNSLCVTKHTFGRHDQKWPRRRKMKLSVEIIIVPTYTRPKVPPSTQNDFFLTLRHQTHFASPNPDCVTKLTLRHFRPKVPWVTKNALSDAKCIAIQTHKIFCHMSPPPTASMTRLGNSFPQLHFHIFVLQFWFSNREQKSENLRRAWLPASRGGCLQTKIIQDSFVANLCKALWKRHHFTPVKWVFCPVGARWG